MGDLRGRDVPKKRQDMGVKPVFLYAYREDALSSPLETLSHSALNNSLAK